MLLTRRKTPAPHIPFISLADIAWQIIIFFLIASTWAQNLALSVPMPSGSPANVANPTRTLSVRAGETHLTVNGADVSVEQLESYVAGLLSGMSRDEDKAVIVFPDDDLTFQRNAEILYAIQKAGGIVIISEERKD
ncbi:MAG TPA: biopolymer transporter ExbD [Tepidisphaeraceae bacterium]|nr:biopolymer transporter ExbD [Tepidisphaeraceae bacterium]